MSDRETEFDFDFFEEQETQEAPVGARPSRRRRRPSVGPPGGLTPLLRLIGLIAFAIAVVVVLVLAVQSCRSDDKRDKYATYMQGIARSPAIRRAWARSSTSCSRSRASSWPASRTSSTGSSSSRSRT